MHNLVKLGSASAITQVKIELTEVITEAAEDEDHGTEKVEAKVTIDFDPITRVDLAHEEDEGHEEGDGRAAAAD